MSRREQGELEAGMSLLCGSSRGSEERPRHCCGPKLHGDWDGRRSGEGFETTAPFGPQLRLCLGAASPGPVYGSFALGQRGSPRRGSTFLSPAGCGVKISVSAAGLLRCGRRTGKSPGREMAEPEPQSCRPEEGRAPRDSARLQLHPPAVQPQRWNLEAWEGLAPRSG